MYVIEKRIVLSNAILVWIMNMTSYSLIQTLYMLFPCTNENEMENYVHTSYKYYIPKHKMEIWTINIPYGFKIFIG